LHLWCRGDVTGSSYGVGIDPCVRSCGGSGAKVEYPDDLSWSAKFKDMRGGCADIDDGEEEVS